MKHTPVYGLMAEFDNPEAVVHAARKTYEAGYKKIDAYSPFPIEALSEAIGFHYNFVPLVVLIGCIRGGLSGFALQYWIHVINYPVVVGGRPLNSWPAFIVVTFEMTILFAGISAVLGMLWLNGLPQPYHPVFNVPAFEPASRNRFFLMILSRDPKFAMEGTREFLEKLEVVMV